MCTTKELVTGTSLGRSASLVVRGQSEGREIVSQGTLVKPHLFHINAEFTIPALVIDF